MLLIKAAQEGSSVADCAGCLFLTTPPVFGCGLCLECEIAMGGEGSALPAAVCLCRMLHLHLHCAQSRKHEHGNRKPRHQESNLRLQYYEFLDDTLIVTVFTSEY
jgi:hypothetical protein